MWDATRTRDGDARLSVLQNAPVAIKVLMQQGLADGPFAWWRDLLCRGVSGWSSVRCWTWRIYDGSYAYEGAEMERRQEICGQPQSAGTARHVNRVQASCWPTIEMNMQGLSTTDKGF